MPYIGVSNHYLVDGGPTKNPGGLGRVLFFHNVLENFMKVAFKPDSRDTFKCDGIMVTHPDADHVQGVVELIEKFHPNENPEPGMPKFEFKGPLLLTKAFETEHYCHIITSIRNAHFEKDTNFYSGKEIDGFESIFTFFYPKWYHPGTLYKYKPPISFLSMSMMAMARYDPVSAAPNPSSTLLVINDPNPKKVNPLVSLNGDALGHSIIKSLNNSNPKIFKVSHHGSVHNSIALVNYEPKEKKLTSILLATLALLEVEKDNDELAMKLVSGAPLKSYENEVTNLHCYNLRGRRTNVDIVKFEFALSTVAKHFVCQLKNLKVNTTRLFNILQQRYNKIYENIDDNTVDSVNLYTSGVPDLPNDFSESTYDIAKTRVTAQTNRKYHWFGKAYRKIFSILESDREFEEDVAFHLNRAFFSKVKAQTYFISCGDRHKHPNWEVVNGIIAAAHDEHKKNASYKCRLLITSRININDDKLQELSDDVLKTDWSELLKYVSIQLFVRNTSSVIIDTNESDPTTYLPGTVLWRPETMKKKRKINFDQRKVEGAKELKRLRAADTGRYEIQPYGDKEHWLALTNAGLVLSKTKAEISINKLSDNMRYALQGFEIEYNFEQQNNSSIAMTVYGIQGIHTPSSGIKSYRLFIYDSNKKRQYINVNKGMINYYNSESSATYFVFTHVKIKKFSSFSRANLASMSFDTEESEVQPNFRMADYTLQLNDFLLYVHYENSTVLCQTLLDIIFDGQFSAKLLSDFLSESQIKTFLTTILGFAVDESSSFVIQDSQVIFCSINLVLPSQQLKFHEYIITQIVVDATDPKTINQKVTLHLETNDNGIPVTLLYHLKVNNDVQSYQNYLTSLGITKSASTFKMIDAVICLLQSETAGLLLLRSLSQKMVDSLLELNISEEESTVEFVSFPTGPIVLSADIIAQLPPSGVSVDVGFSNTLKLTKVGFTLPNQLDSSDSMFLFADATLGSFEVNIKCCVPINDDDLPDIDVNFKLANSFVLNDILNLFNLSSDISNFTIPLVSKAIKDVQVTQAGFTCEQVIQNAEQVYLSSVRFGFEFSNLNEYLPSAFSNLKNVSAIVVVYQPQLTLGLDVKFDLDLEVSEDKTTSISASFVTTPVSTNDTATPSAYDFTVSVQAKSDVVGTTEGGIRLADFLRVFNLGDDLSIVQNVPFLSSFLEDFELKQLVLSFNTNNKDIKAFGLDLLVLNVVIIPDKMVLNESLISVNFINEQWMSKFSTVATLGDKFQINIEFEISNNDVPAKFTFKNSNFDFTVSKFFDVFGLSGFDDIPVVGQLLNVSVTEASLQMSKEHDGSVVVSEGMVSLYAESIDIGSLFHLSQVNVSIAFILDVNEKKYIFGFSVSGFVNNKIYLDIQYDYNTSVLSGQVLVSTFMEADVKEVVDSLLNETNKIEDNAAYKKFSQSPSLNMEISIKKSNASDYRVTDLMISISNAVAIGHLSLQNIRFEYHVSEEGTSLYIISGKLVSKMHNIGAVLEFDLTMNTTGKNIVTASLKPTEKNSLTLSSFLSLLNIASPPIPEVEGQDLPNFFDLALTKGSLTLSLPTFEITAFQVHIETTNEVTILDSPLIKLKEISLAVDYDEERSTNVKTKATLLGCFEIGGINLTLEGRKETNGTIFSIAASSVIDNADLQQSIDTLKPIDTTSQVIPSNIGIPKHLNVSVAELVVKFLYETKETSITFSGESLLDWPINLGFQQFTVKEVGGKILYKKQGETNSSTYDVYITGQFQYSNSILMSSSLRIGTEHDLVLSVSVSDTNQISLLSLTDDTLGFNHSNDDESNVSFQSLLPDTTASINMLDVFININFTKSLFVAFSQVVSLGYGFLIAGNFSDDTNTLKYGYVFGISLSDGFKFSDIISALEPIDEILKIHNANCMVVSVDNVKVTEVVSKIDAAKEATSYFKDSQNKLPFSNLTLDEFTNDQMLLSSGLSLYFEINFHTTKEGSLFNSIIKISNDSEGIPNIVVSSFINKVPDKSEFKGFISNLTLLGAFEFSNIMLVYSPASKTHFQLIGKVTVKIGDVNFDFLGQFMCTNTQSQFTVSTANEQVIKEPLGMFGISLKNATLSLLYNYPSNKPHSSTQAIFGKVNFYSSSQDDATPSITLACAVLFNNYSPTVVKIELKPKNPLTIADFINTVFKWKFNCEEYLNIGFVKGQVYYADLGNKKQPITIDKVAYKNGYHISADIEIFNEGFTIEADILSNTSEVSIHGFAHAALDLGFAKFTGIDDNDHSQPDESKSPTITFITNQSSTSISLDIGFVLFDVPLGKSKIGYKSNNGKKSFFGELTYHGNIGFLKNPAISFEWSEEDGFRVTNWPALGSFKDSFDFFKALTQFNDQCGSLGDLLFKEGVQTQFNINIKLSNTTDTKSFLANIEITGTYDVLLFNKVKISSVPLPDIQVGIPREENFTLYKLPQFILDLFAKNASNIVKQVAENPERLAKIIALSSLKTVTKKVIGTLVCRNVDTSNIDPSDGGDDIINDDFEEANKAEGSFNEAVKTFDSTFEGSELGEAAVAAASVEAAGDVAIGLFAGIIAFFTSILAFFNIGHYREKKEKAELKKKQITEKVAKIKKKMQTALDIKENPSAVFTPPDKLTVSWKLVSYENARYHLQIKGSVLSENNLGMTNARAIDLFDDVVSNSPYVLQKDAFYNVTGLKVFVNGTIEANNNGQKYEYNGKVYSVDVQNVHPTLHPPSNIHILYHHLSRNISVTASPAKYAEKYYFELIDKNGDSLSQCTFNPPPQSNEIHCNFSHSCITASSVSPFKVRGQAIAKSGSSLASSTFAYSNDLSILDPIRNLSLTIPQFGEEHQSVSLTWELPVTADERVSGFTCQILCIKDNSKTVIISNEVVTIPLSTSFGFEINKIIDAIAQTLSSVPNDDIELLFQISASSNSEHLIDSIFVGESITSLKAPQNVSFKVHSESGFLQVSWIYNQETSKYAVEIKNSDSNVMYSNVFIIKKDQNIEGDKVVGDIYLKELANLIDPNTKYSIEVSSVPAGNEELHSLVPSIAENPLQVFTAPDPHSANLAYIAKKDSIIISFKSVENVSKYLINVHDKNILASKVITDSQPLIKAYVPMDQLVFSIQSGKNIGISIQSLGEGHFLNSAVSKVAKYLTVLPQPSNLMYSYTTATESTKLTCLPVPNETFAYKLGFFDPNGALPNITQIGKISEDGITSTFSADNLRNSKAKQWKGFVQASLAADSTSQLPSPYLLLTSDIHLLAMPLIQMLTFDIKSTILTATTLSDPNAYNYQMNCTFYDDSNAILNQVSETFPSSTSNKEVRLNIVLKKKIPEWNSLYIYKKRIIVTVTAVGFGNYLTSKPSEPSSLTINQQMPPFNLTYSYSRYHNEDAITLSCQVQDVTPKVKAILGLMDVNDNKNKIVKLADSNYGIVTVKITGQEIRQTKVKEWIVFAQSIETSSSLPSLVVTLPDHVHVLSVPVITSMNYDASTTNLSINWSPVSHTERYHIKLQYVSQSGRRFTINQGVARTNPKIKMNRQITNWMDELLTTMTITITSIGKGLYINSNASDTYKFNRAPPLSNINISSNDATTTVSWDNIEGISDYTITFTGGDISFSKTTQSSSITVRNLLFLHPTLSPQFKSIEVRVASAINKSLSSSPAVKQVDMRTQQIYKSKVFGSYDGIGFDDGVEAMNSIIVGIHSLVVFHDTYVESLQATYVLSNGSTYTAPSHGKKNEQAQKTVIKFSKLETIVGVSASSSTSMAGLYELVIVTQGEDDTLKKYGPFGRGEPNNGFIPIRFSGNVLSFIGSYSEEHINAIGFNYTDVSPVILMSELFSGKGGSMFDNDIITHLPRIVGIKSIELGYNYHHLVYIQPTYHLEDGSTFVAAKQGGRFTSQVFTKHLEFETDECIIAISGSKYFDRNLMSPSAVIGHLSLTTQKKDGTISEYGPYGEGGKYYDAFTVTGKIMGFFGEIGWFVDGLGMYYSLQKSELFGGTGGSLFDDKVTSHVPQIVGIKSLEICYRKYEIVSIQALYLLGNGSTWQAACHGNKFVNGDNKAVLEIENEQIVILEMSKYDGASLLQPNYVIGHLKMVTQLKDGTRKVYGPYGMQTKETITINGRVIGFFGQSEAFLDALGVYTII